MGSRDIRDKYLCSTMIWEMGLLDEYGDRLKVQHRLMSAGIQWASAFFFVVFCFLLMMKVKLGNKVLAWLGGVTLEFYLMHGIFVELFGYNFLDISKSIVYIKSVPLFIAAVLGCAVPATLLFRLLWKKVTVLLTGSGKSKAENAAPGASGTEETQPV